MKKTGPEKSSPDNRCANNRDSTLGYSHREQSQVKGISFFFSDLASSFQVALIEMFLLSFEF